jgi:hypothetical protein
MDNKNQIRDKNYLFLELSKKVTTVNIGAIANFENYFGILWGHGKQEHELTEIEKEWKNIWLECRKAILDNGSSQIRLISQLLSGYEVEKVIKKIEIGKMENGQYVAVKHPMIVKGY